MNFYEKVITKHYCPTMKFLICFVFLLITHTVISHNYHHHHVDDQIWDESNNSWEVSDYNKIEQGQVLKYNSNEQFSTSNAREIPIVKRQQQEEDAGQMVKDIVNIIANNLPETKQKERKELSTLKPPYERLPNSYHGIYPTSYYATHTYIPPIKIPSPESTKAPIFDSLDTSDDNREKILKFISSKQPRKITEVETSSADIEREQFNVIFANREPAKLILKDDIASPGKKTNVDRVTIVTPSENQNFTDKDARSVKKPKPVFTLSSHTLRDFSKEAIDDNLSLPSVHSLDIQGNEVNVEQNFPNPDAEKLIQIKPITDTYLAPEDDEKKSEKYVKALAYTVNDDYYDSKAYEYYDTLADYGDTYDDTSLEPKPESTLGDNIPLSKLRLPPNQLNSIDTNSNNKLPATLYSLPGEDQNLGSQVQSQPNNYNINGNIKGSQVQSQPSNYNINGNINGGLSYENVIDVSNYNINNNYDDTDDEPWPESFDPMKPEKPFLPIINNNREQNSIIEHEAHSNLISYKRPQRNQKQFDIFSYPTTKDGASSKSFKPSIKGPKEFFPSIKAPDHWVVDFHTTSARSLQLPPTQNSGLLQSVTTYYDPPTTVYPSPSGNLATQATTQKSLYKNYHSEVSIYPSLSGMNAEKNKLQFGKSFQYDSVSYTPSTTKPVQKEAVWPSNQLPPPISHHISNNQNLIDDSHKRKFNDNISSKRRRKLKNKHKRAKRRRNRLFKNIFKNTIAGRSRKRFLHPIAKYLREKRRKALLEDKIRRGIPYPHLPASKQLPEHMKNSLLVLMPEGPRSPFFETIANSLLPPHRRHAPTTRIGQTLNKLMGGHLLDRRIDGIDFLPFLTVLVAAGLLTAGLFGDDFTNLNLFGDFGGLNDGNLILKAKTENPNTPRRFSRAIQGSNRSLLDGAITQLESSMLMINQLRDPNLEEECTEKLACQMGVLVNSSPLTSISISKSNATDLFVNVVSTLLPKQSATKFAQSFQSAINGTDRSSCYQECKKRNQI